MSQHLPPAVTPTGDPSDGNPFSGGTAAHKVWADATLEAEVEVASIKAKFLGEAAGAQSAVPSDYVPGQREIEMHAAIFDAWAKRCAHVVWSDAALSHFDDWLRRYANDYLEKARKLYEGASPEWPTDWVLTRFRNALAGRVEFWKEQARRYRAAQQAASSEPFEIPSRISVALKKKRRDWLKLYRTEHDLTASAFALQAGISESGILGIVNEDTRRFSVAKRDQLLKVLGISLREWYGA